MPNDFLAQKLSSNLDINPGEILCTFNFDNQECFAFKVCEDSIVNYNNNSLTEICRFNVNGCTCVIVTKKKSEHETSTLKSLLSAREIQIACLIASGCPNKQVADKLHISEWTVATYLRRIYAKLGVDTRAAMTYRCAPLIATHAGK